MNFTFRLSDNGMADIDTRQMALVDIYEYYRPGMTTRVDLGMFSINLFTCNEANQVRSYNCFNAGLQVAV